MSATFPPCVDGTAPTLQVYTTRRFGRPPHFSRRKPATTEKRLVRFCRCRPGEVISDPQVCQKCAYRRPPPPSPLGNGG